VAHLANAVAFGLGFNCGFDFAQESVQYEKCRRTLWRLGGLPTFLQSNEFVEDRSCCGLDGGANGFPSVRRIVSICANPKQRVKNIPLVHTLHSLTTVRESRTSIFARDELSPKSIVLADSTPTQKLPSEVIELPTCGEDRLTSRFGPTGRVYIPQKTEAFRRSSWVNLLPHSVSSPW